MVQGGLVAIAVHDGGIAIVVEADRIVVDGPDAVDVVREAEAALTPRWVWWSAATPSWLDAHGIRVAKCWDLAAVHRLIYGRWQADPAIIWAELHGLPIDRLPSVGQLDLLSDPIDVGDPDVPVQPDGHLRPEWVDGAWRDSGDRCVEWAALAWNARELQAERLDSMSGPRLDARRAHASAHSESAAELLCCEMGAAGLPIDVARAEEIIGSFVGPRQHNEQDEQRSRDRRDAAVLSHLTHAEGIDLRNPAHVKAMLRRVAVDVPDTRAWRLEPFRESIPLVDALLTWRKAERISTTFGYRWLDEHVSNGRLRGDWSASDGAAGRMTASAGLHNLPADMRDAVAAESGRVFVRADLGQIEPRVLAAVSGDHAFILATEDDDLYAPVAARLGVDRSIAKVAVLGAMYGGTTGESANALRGLESAYPVAMKFLNDAAEAGRAGRDLRTVGGRLVRLWSRPDPDTDPDQERRVAASRGRYARNAMIQGAAAEFFKVWAVTVRARGAALDAHVVLCLHDELLVDAPVEHGEAVRQLVHHCLQETAFRWSPEPGVRFVADVSVIARWSHAK